MKRILLFSLLIIFFSAEVFGNFAGYQRENIEGFGSSLNIINDNSVSLKKERLEFTLDQRVRFKGYFEFKNTSNSIKKLSFAFPQNSFWEIPYKDGYKPGNYFVLSPVIKVNKKIQKNIAHLFSKRSADFSKPLKVLSKDEMEPILLEWAGDNEAENPPTMPIILWLVFDQTIEPHQTININIEFSVPWYFQDEEWSYGIESDGTRMFEYITSTAITWKGGVVKDFEAKVIFPEDVGRSLTLFPKDWVKNSLTQASIVKHNFAPSLDDHIKFIWQSSFQLYSVDSWNSDTSSLNQHIVDCWKNLTYNGYQWRFLTDNSISTSWCIQPTGLNCPQYFLKKSGNTEDNKIYSGFIITNGFAKTESLFKANSRPKKMTFLFKSHTKKWSQEIILKDTPKSQSFKLKHPINLSEYGISFKINDVFQGLKWDDICISEFKFIE